MSTQDILVLSYCLSVCNTKTHCMPKVEPVGRNLQHYKRAHHKMLQPKSIQAPYRPSGAIEAIGTRTSWQVSPQGGGVLCIVALFSIVDEQVALCDNS